MLLTALAILTILLAIVLVIGWYVVIWLFTDWLTTAVFQVPSNYNIWVHLFLFVVITSVSTTISYKAKKDNK